MANEFKVKKGLIVEGSGGTILDIQGSVGQLFSITDSLTGDLFAVSDISGIPILNVNSSGAVDIDGDLSITDDVTLSNFGAGYLKTNVNGVVSNTATIPWATVSSTPTTISGYGITDALVIGTTATTAMAGNTAIPSATDILDLLSTNNILNWTVDQGTTNIHSGNYNNTQLSNAEVISAIVASSSIDNTDKGTIRSNIGAGTSSLTIGTTSTTAMAGDTLSAQDLTDIGNLSGTNTGDQDLSSYITSQRAISSTPTDGATTTAISSDWAFDNVKTAVPANAVFTDTVNTFDGAYSSLSGTPTIPSGNAIIDWTADQGNTNIHSGNYSNTQLSQEEVLGMLTAGANITITTDGEISATDTVYTHPTSAGNKHIPSGGAAGQFLKYSASGTATWATPSYTTNTNTTYSAGGGLDLTGTTFSVEPDLRDGITHVGKDTSNFIEFDSTEETITFIVGGNAVAVMESDGDLHIKGDVIAFSDIFNP